MVYAKRYFSSCCVQQVCCFENLSGIVPEYWTRLTLMWMSMSKWMWTWLCMSMNTRNMNVNEMNMKCPWVLSYNNETNLRGLRIYAQVGWPLTKVLSEKKKRNLVKGVLFDVMFGVFEWLHCILPFLTVPCVLHCESFIFLFRPQFMLKDVCRHTVSNTFVVLTNCSPTLLRGDEMRNENGCRWSASALRNLFQWAARTKLLLIWNNWCWYAIKASFAEAMVVTCWWPNSLFECKYLVSKWMWSMFQHSPSLLWLCVIYNGLSRLSILWPFPRNMCLIAKCRAAIVLVQ